MALKHCTGVVVHHTNSHDVSIKEVEQWHKARDWPHVGYHYLIRSDGMREVGCPITEEGIHARGRNHTHIGVALTGSFSGDPPNSKTLIEPTSRQLLSLKSLLESLCDEFKISPLRIERHHSLCPGDRLPLEELIRGLHVKSNAVDSISKVKSHFIKAYELLDEGQAEFRLGLDLMSKI